MIETSETIIVKEKLAAIEHERWADWQRYVFSKGQFLTDASFRLPRELSDRWLRQCATPYKDLSRAEQLSDLKEVERYWPLIDEYVEFCVKKALSAYKKLLKSKEQA